MLKARPMKFGESPMLQCDPFAFARRTNWRDGDFIILGDGVQLFPIVRGYRHNQLIIAAARQGVLIGIIKGDGLGEPVATRASPPP